MQKTAKNPPRGPVPVEPLLDRGAEAARWLFPVFIFLILAGFFALRLNGVKPAGLHLTHDRAVFTAVNAATCTGFQLSDHPTEFFTPGKVIVFVLMVCGALFSLVVGGLALKRILRLDWPDRRIVVAALVMLAFVMILGLFAPVGISRAGGGVFAGVFQTTAAFANCGLYIGERPLASDPFTHVILLPLALAGGLGMVTLLEILDSLLHRRPMSTHTTTVIRLAALAYLIGFAACALLQLMDLPALGQGKTETWPAAFARLWPSILRNSSILTLDTRSAGLAALPITGQPRGLVFFLMFLMVAGAGNGGTAGGLRLTTVREILTAPIGALKGVALGRPFGIAMTWAGVYLAAVLFFQVLLLASSPQTPGDRLLFLTISALSNVGLAHDTIAMTGPSLYYLSAAMFAGRIIPLLLLWWMADTVKDAEIAVC